jgi:hypothetical protein
MHRRIPRSSIIACYMETLVFSSDSLQEINSYDYNLLSIVTFVRKIKIADPKQC